MRPNQTKLVLEHCSGLQIAKFFLLQWPSSSSEWGDTENGIIPTWISISWFFFASLFFQKVWASVWNIFFDVRRVTLGMHVCAAVRRRTVRYSSPFLFWYLWIIFTAPQEVYWAEGKQAGSSKKWEEVRANKLSQREWETCHRCAATISISNGPKSFCLSLLI